MLAKTKMCDNRLCMKASAIHNRHRTKAENFVLFKIKYTVSPSPGHLDCYLSFLLGFNGNFSARQVCANEQHSPSPPVKLQLLNFISFLRKD